MENSRGFYEDKIAIIGMSGRLPGSDDMETFWDNISSGKDCITKIPKSRWDTSEYFDPEIGKKGHIYCDYIGAVNDPDCFDARFFEITPAQATEMDPQHRLFLEQAYAAFEDAGYSHSQLDGAKCGVYLGIVDDDYSSLGDDALSAVGNSNAIGAARIAYFLNLKGPALAIDTACSSAMVGLHLAVNALRLHEIDMALAGGSCLYITKESYISMCEAGMLSPTGRCSTFDNDADGFVPGEGIAALVLKRLSDAERDHDHIYGLIVGCGMNQDGKTNGITAPNLGSQKMLEEQVYSQFGIDPETISYAEFHGTGTKLGDPIELDAIKGAFKSFTDKKSFCAIGALKSNLGHTSATSGIAGIEKILLCMKHQQLVPTLHVKNVNEHFDLENSAFYINKDLKTWDGPHPLRACISSFGFSGTNVHAVIEEYPDKKREPSDGGLNIFVLSARNKKQLAIYVENILKFLEKDVESREDFFYTLQTGREFFEERIAVVTDSIDSLKKSLKGYIEEKTPDESGVMESTLTRNQIKLKEASYKAFHKDADHAGKNIISRDESSLIDLSKKWLSGEIIDFGNMLYEDIPYRMSIPGYPFERMRCWYAPKTDKAMGQSVASKIHPLIGENVSDFYAQRYRSVFSGEEFFLKDHIVNGKKILPGAAIMEMMRKAAELSLGKKITRLTQVCFLNAISFMPDTKVEVRLLPVSDKNDEVEVSVYQINGSDTSILCSKCYAASSDISASDKPDLKGALDKCDTDISGDRFYGAIKGIDYGDTFRVVGKIGKGKEQALALLSAKDSSIDESFVLHPALLDGAMQTVSVLMRNVKSEVYLPFSIDEIKIYGAMSSKLKVLSRNAQADSEFDIDICDEDGNILVKIKDLFLKEIQQENEEKVEGKLSIFAPVWVDKPLSGQESDISDKEKTIVISADEAFCREFADSAQKEGFDEVKCISDLSRLSEESYWDEYFKDMKVKSDSALNIVIEQIYDKGMEMNLFDAFYALCKTIIKNHLSEKAFVSYFAKGNIPKAAEQALAGLFRGIQSEISGISMRYVWLRDNFSADSCAQILAKEKAVTESVCEVRYQKGIRQVLNYDVVEQKEKTLRPVKEGGSYLITGGLGGVGYLTARYVAKTPSVKLYLTGRSALSEKMKEKIKTLEDMGAYCEYIKGDITDKENVEKLIEKIEKEGTLRGVFHCAGVTKDSLFINKKLEDAHNVLKPKITGTKLLDEAIGDREIDFFVTYSSNAATLGNIGQVDYCFANSYMDHFAYIREFLCRQKLRKGKTVSINWPLWINGKMQIDEESKAFMRREFGIVPMGDEEAFTALENALMLESPQIMVFTGDVNKAKEVLLKAREVTGRNTTVEKNEIHEDSADLTERESAVSFMRKFIAEKTGLSEDEIEEGTPFGEFGIDSIQILSLTRALEERFGNLAKTLFFEYGNLGALSDYFLNHHKEKLADWMGKDKRADSPKESEAIKSGEDVEKPRSVRFIATSSEKEPKESTTDIAVIGISGKYPMADNLSQLWDNLVAGKDCIQEVPKDRWNHDEFFDPDKSHKGKCYTKWGGFINDVDKFDPIFFNVPPIEAEFMDPQVRLFLESCWHTMEDAGYTRDAFSGKKVGVYTGVMYGMYQLFKGKVDGALIPANSSYSAISNMVSYFFDLKGPSIAIDTMCSSSLTALHFACEDIRHGRTDMAFVGGVNLSIHPNKYQILSYAHFASSDGRCRSFGEGGDGYVPGEGVGSLLLKPLQKAIDDGDHIYGIIKGSAVNAGGKTTGFTVPSPVAQAEVIEEALSHAKVSPESVSYIEAHGTGTSLGDPIEIEGLNKVFGDKLPKNSCAIGSLKSNIGHLEAAAGVAGVTKVLLQMQKETLVPSIHSEKLNPFVDFEGGPFFVQHETKEWKGKEQIVNGEKKKVLRAGVSCFGAGGSNCHVVLENYLDTRQKADDKTAERLFVFSARNDIRLKEYLNEFTGFLDGQKAKDITALQVAYVLQTGREAMEERLAIIAGSLNELSEKIKAYIAGKENEEGIYHGNILDSKEELKEKAKEIKSLKTDSLFNEGKLQQIAKYWIIGATINFKECYKDTKVIRCSLPVYPFAKDRYWVDGKEERSASAESAGLLKENTSDIYGLKFASHFRGDEQFLKNHRVFGKPLMPAAAFVEMALEASRRLFEDSSEVFSLKNMAFIRPAYVEDNGLDIEVSAEVIDENTVLLHIGDGNKPEIVYSKVTVERKADAKEERTDLSNLKEKITHEVIDTKKLYRMFEESGLVYGESFRAIKALFDRDNEALSLLETTKESKEIVLAPALLDGALQSAIAFALSDKGKESSGEASLPFAFDEMKVFANDANKAVAYLKKNGADHDISLFDESGRLLAKVSGMVFRKGNAGKDEPKTAYETGIYIPMWREG